MAEQQLVNKMSDDYVNANSAHDVAELPLRRCEDCRLDLCRDVLRALSTCPRWGKPREGVESRCAAFVAKSIDTMRSQRS